MYDFIQKTYSGFQSSCLSELFSEIELRDCSLHLEFGCAIQVKGGHF